MEGGRVGRERLNIAGEGLLAPRGRARRELRLEAIRTRSLRQAHPRSSGRIALGESHAQRMNYAVAVSNRVAHPFARVELLNCSSSGV